MNLRTVQIALWTLAGIAAVALPVALLQQQPATERPQGVSLAGGPFTLVSSKGGTFDSRVLQGRPYAIFFGFTYCPDICPTTVAEITGYLNVLGPAAKDFPVLFVSVDPQRDTPDVLKDFLSNFDPKITGLTGTPEQIAQVVAAYKVYAKRVDLDGGNYTMDHSASIYLYDAGGQLRSTLDYKEKPEIKLQKIKNLLGV
jgi:protein SCO1/2